MYSTEHGRMARDEHNGFVTGLLCGAAVGAAIALLVAPKAGAELRRTLADSASRLREQGRNAYDSASASVGRVVDQGRRVAEEGRSRVEDAVQEARAVYADEVDARERDLHGI